MYVALPVGTAADKWGEGEKKNHTAREGKEYSAAGACPHVHTHTRTLRMKKWMHPFLKMNTFENSFFYISIKSCVFNYRFQIHRDIYTHKHRHTHTPLQYFCLFILCRLIPKWHFLWSPVYVSSQTGLSSLLLLSRLLCVSVVPYMRSQWNNGLFPVKKNWVCQV